MANVHSIDNVSGKFTPEKVILQKPSTTQTSVTNLPFLFLQTRHFFYFINAILFVLKRIIFSSDLDHVCWKHRFTDPTPAIRSESQQRSRETNLSSRVVLSITFMKIKEWIMFNSMYIRGK